MVGSIFIVDSGSATFILNDVILWDATNPDGGGVGSPSWLTKTVQVVPERRLQRLSLTRCH
jgi:hypothetical protein